MGQTDVGTTDAAIAVTMHQGLRLWISGQFRYGTQTVLSGPQQGQIGEFLAQVSRTGEWSGDDSARGRGAVVLLHAAAG